MRSIEDILWEGWSIESVLGKGSYGTVYKAYKKDFDSCIYSAIKHLSIPYDESEISTIKSEGMTKAQISDYFSDVVRHISDEIRLMDSLKGTANIVSIEDFKIIKNDELSWDILIRMEILDDLNSFFCNKTGSISDIVKMGIDICNSLEYCEKSNIIHRDIKPENIFVNKFGNFKLGDFGIAREYTQNRADMSMRGTPYYIAPEVFEGKQYDLTVDIYSLGIVLYRLLNDNKLPFFPLDSIATFQQRNDALKMRIAGEKFAPPVNTIPELTEVIYKACAYNSVDRYKSASEFKQDLMRVSDTLSSMELQPQYSFIVDDIEEIELGKKSNTYDLSKGTLLLDENIIQPDTKKKRKRSKNKLILIAFLVVFIAGIIIALNIPKGDSDDAELYSGSTTTAALVSKINSTVSENSTSKTTEDKTEKSTSKQNENASANYNTTKKVVTKNTDTTTKRRKVITSKTTTKKATTAKKTTATKKVTTTKKTTTGKGKITNLNLSYSSGSIHVSWSKASGAVEYIVNMSGPNSYSKSFTTSSTSADFLVGSKAGKYTVTVTPIYKDGKYGSSASKSCKVK